MGYNLAVTTEMASSEDFNVHDLLGISPDLGQEPRTCCPRAWGPATDTLPTLSPSPSLGAAAPIYTSCCSPAGTGAQPAWAAFNGVQGWLEESLGQYLIKKKKNCIILSLIRHLNQESEVCLNTRQRFKSIHSTCPTIPIWQNYFNWVL